MERAEEIKTPWANDVQPEDDPRGGDWWAAKRWVSSHLDTADESWWEDMDNFDRSRIFKLIESAYSAGFRAGQSAEQEIVMKVTDEMVDRFLTWPLPDSVHCDPCASMKGYPRRIGTNLLTATEARQMLEHVLATSLPEERTASDEKDSI